MPNQVILVTGFEPWGKWTRNPSGEVAEELGGESIGDFTLATGVLPVSFGDDVEAAVGLIEAHQPVAVVSVGLGGGSAIRMERVALNLKAGDRGEERILEDGPDAYFTSLPVDQMAARVRRVGIPAVVSYHAGTFTCNHIMCRLRHLAEIVGPGIPSGFIHVPPMPEQVASDSKPEESLAKELIKKGVMEAIAVVVESVGTLAVNPVSK
jgi:pyroglutamyl-peptidase